MCGIAGYVTVSNKIHAGDMLRKMAGAMSHRGPDDEGFFYSESKSGNEYIGLAHRRLSIIDLTTGHQPIGNEDGTVQIVFNGEIYNYQELRDELISRGHVFQTASDTETIVHAYEEYGETCLEKLRGMFAFAIWDGKRERLFLARDRFGKKPLFYHVKDGSLLFASEIKALLGVTGVSTHMDAKAISDYLVYRYVPGPSTFFSEIWKLPPGSFAFFEKGQLRIKRYYYPPDRLAFVPGQISEDPSTAFLRQLEEAVRIRMVSDVPFGAFLSGGIDSSAVVGLMSRYSGLPIKTFSVGFREYSELQYARTVATHFGTEHHELLVTENDIIDQLPKLVRFRDAPISEPADIPIYLLSVEARRTVKMVLTGEGSDEVLGGYPKHKFEHVFLPPYQMIPGFVRRQLIEPLLSALPGKYSRIKTAASCLAIADPKERFPRWFGAFTSEDSRKLLRQDFWGSTQSSDDTSFLTEPHNSPLRKILYFDQMSWLPDNLLERGDRMTMAASIEARMPFMDHVLISFISSLPDRYRIRYGTGKWILKRAMREILPRQILGRPKVGFRMPIDQWFRGGLRDYLRDNLTGPSSTTALYYDRKSLEAILDEHSTGRQNHGKLLWALLNLEILQRSSLKDL